MKDFQDAAKLEPAFVGGQYRIAQAALKLNDPTTGLQALDTISLLDPKLSSNTAMVGLRQELQAAKEHAAATSQPSLSSDNQMELDTLSLLYEQAQAAKDTSQRNALLSQFMVRSAKFVIAYPDETKLWACRGAIALELNQAKDGWEAGTNLRRLHPDGDSTRILLAKLNAAGWIADNWDDVERTIAQKRKQSWLGTWHAEVGGPIDGTGSKDIDKADIAITGNETCSESLVVSMDNNDRLSVKISSHFISHEVDTITAINDQYSNGKTSLGKKVGDIDWKYDGEEWEDRPGQLITKDTQGNNRTMICQLVDVEMLRDAQVLKLRWKRTFSDGTTKDFVQTFVKDDLADCVYSGDVFTKPDDPDPSELPIVRQLGSKYPIQFGADIGDPTTETKYRIVKLERKP